MFSAIFTKGNNSHEFLLTAIDNEVFPRNCLLLKEREFANSIGKGGKTEIVDLLFSVVKMGKH